MARGRTRKPAGGQRPGESVRARSDLAESGLLSTPAVAVSALALCCIAAFVPVFGAGYIWDDDLFLTQNPLIHAPDGLYKFWCTTQPPDYFPLTSSLLWLEWRLWGGHPLGFHAVNVALHAANAALLWLVFRRLAVPGAWLAAAVFALHPVNVESVAWITETKSTLPLALALTSLLAWTRSDDKAVHGPAWYALSLLCYVLALTAKTSVVPFAAVLLLIAWWKKGAVTRRDLLRAAPYFVLAVVFGVITLWFQSRRSIGELRGGFEIRTDSFGSRLAIAGIAIWFYVWKALVPVGLSFVYPRWELNAGNPTVWAGWAGLAVLYVWLWSNRRTWARPWLACLTAYIAMLFPTLGFVNVFFMRYSLVADHWQYAAMPFFAALAGAGLHLLWTRDLVFPGLRSKKLRYVCRLILRGAPCLVLALLGILTFRQSLGYRDPESLWRATIFANPRAWIAHCSLASILRAQGKPQEAVQECRKALLYNPDYPEAHANLANLLLDAGNTDEAIVHYRRSIELKGNLPTTHNNYGQALEKAGRIDEAVREYETAISLLPDFALPYTSYGMLLIRQGRVEEGIARLKRALELNPSDQEARAALEAAERSARTSTPGIRR